MATWTSTTLGAGESVSYLLPPTISASTVDGTAIAWTATVRDTTGVRATDSQTLSVDTSVAFKPAIDQDQDQDPVAAGGRMIYTVTYGNIAGAYATDTALSFPIPAGGSFVSATNGGTFTNGVVTWDIGILFDGTTGQVQVVVNIAADVAAGTLSRSTAR